MESGLTLATLQSMKRDGRKIVGVVAWDFQIAQIADRAGVDLISVGDSVGVNLWGREADAAVSVDEMLICCKAVRRGARRAMVSCDVPARADPVRAARRLAEEGGAAMVKVLGDPDVVRAVVAAGVPVFAEFHGGNIPVDGLVDRARRLEEAGASLLDFRHSGPVAGPAVVRAVSIPVIGGLGGGPWLDGRVRLAHTAIGYATKWIDSEAETYGNAAKVSLEALRALIEDVRAGRQIKGG
ncbi:MAG TPA: 3-methyl-2-oxobutanoate hydroxymethyltransferase [Burkholderiales bacterium]|nr:3-methyl-2-oxobutanoate hydroxymethyltransferase [Burkholderiales bacterium]